jgi:hypothetical protein
VEVLLELAQADRAILRQLTARFDVAAAADELVAATRQAIADATNFDARHHPRPLFLLVPRLGPPKRDRLDHLARLEDVLPRSSIANGLNVTLRPSA